jgi:DNA-directed RNA polymerase specialized sigma24 family protein
MIAPLPSRPVLDRLNRAQLIGHRRINELYDRPEPQDEPYRMSGVLTYAEIAEMKGMSEKGVMLVVHRAMEKLRKFVDSLDTEMETEQQ